MQFALNTNRKRPAIARTLLCFKAKLAELGSACNSVQRNSIHLLPGLKHMEITMQYLNKGSISGGVPTLKIHSCSSLEIFG